MAVLTRFEPTVLVWRRGPETPPTYTLQGEGGPVAILAFLPQDGCLARVQTSEGIWTLRHRAFPAGAVTLRNLGSQVDLATYHPHLGGHGKLKFLDGDTFDWIRFGGTEAGGAFLDKEGMLAVRLTLTPDTSHRVHPPEGIPEGTLETLRPRHHQARPELLGAIGWYLLQVEAVKEQETKAGEASLRL